MSDPGLPLGLPGARALIIGTGSHVPGSVLPDVPAAAGTVREIGRELVARCGLAPDQVRTVIDPADPVVLGEELTSAAESAESILLVYYVGHGLVRDDGELYLATRVTDHLTRGLAYKGLRYATLRETLAGSRARSIVLVLDCCFSGRAAPVGGAANPFESAYPLGGFVLASAAPEELALAPDGDPYTAFSGELLRLLREGDPIGPPQLTLDDVHRYLARTLRERGFPLPRRQSEGRTGELVLTVNPAYRPPEGPPGVDPEPGSCPYRGLAPYGAEDARFFFGREKLTARLVARVAAQLSADGPLVVVGPSGAGKSSLLRAGLLPALDRGLPAEPDPWRPPRVVFTPGERPMKQLARVLAELGHGEAESIRGALMADPESMAGLFAEDATRPMLVVDQFEELFTACADEDEREAFVRALSAACTHGRDGAAPRAVVLLGLRADFYGHCAAHPALADALQNNQVLVGPMDSSELRDAVEQPARLAGLRLEEGLVDLLLRDLRTGGDRQRGAGAALPLLSYALLATWQKRSGRTLTMAGYQASGGIWGAVAQTAQRTYDGLDDAAQQAARQLLLRMVHVIDGAEDTRRRVPRGELDPEVDQAALDALVRARLVVVDDGHAELIHEAVLRAWEQLRKWIERDRAGLLVRQRLHDAADAWDRDGRDEGALYRGVRLAAARQWVEESAQRHGTTPGAREFVAASQARQEAERRAERRRTTRLRALAGTLAVLLLVAVAGVGAAVWQNRIADEQRDILAAKVGAQASDRLRPTDPTLALQLALAARRIADIPEARGSVFDAALAPYYTPIGKHGDTVKKLAYSAERHLLASAGSDQTFRLWDLSDPRHAKSLSVTSTGGDRASLALSKDGRLLAARESGTTVRLWNLNDPAHPVSITTLPDSPGAITMSPDGHMLAVVNDDRSVLWDLTDAQRPLRAAALPGGAGTPQSGAFSPEGHVLAITVNASDGDLAAQLWNVTDPSKPVLTAALANSHALAVAFSPNKPLLAVGSNRLGVRLWDTSNPAAPAAITTANYSASQSLYSSEPVEIAANQVVTAVAFSSDGRTLAAGASAGGNYDATHVEVVNVADPHIPVRIVEYPTSERIYSVLVGEDPATVISTGAANEIRLWHPATAPALINTGLAGDLTRDGRILVWPTDNRTVHGVSTQKISLWRLNGAYDPRPVGAVPAPDAETARAVNDKTLLVFGGDGSAQLWNVTDPADPKRGSLLTELAEPVLHTGDVSARPYVAIEDGLVALNGHDGQIHLWDVADAYAPKPLSTIKAPQPPGQLRLLNRTLVSIDRRDGHRIHIWDVTDPRRPVAAAPVEFPDDVALQAEGPGLLALAMGDTSVNPKTVQLWDLRNPNRPDHGDLPKGEVNGIVISHNGRTLAVTTEKTVDLWDITDIHHPVMVKSLAAERQGGVVFSPDDHLLATTARTALDTDPDIGRVHLWSVADPHAATEIGALAVPGAIDARGFNPDGSSLLVGESGSRDNRTPRVHLIDPDIDNVTKRLCDAVGSTITPDQWNQYFPGTPRQPPCG
ncbi:caspase family protein [Kitasatospora sp. NPDC056531]|uniref:caspase, EACC1-associated type n=1 Tax=Kitasatospora sp. NPDC056531 TaxID=3345856 RepID=UPI0036C69500